MTQTFQLQPGEAESLSNGQTVERNEEYPEYLTIPAPNKDVTLTRDEIAQLAALAGVSVDMGLSLDGD